METIIQIFKSWKTSGVGTVGMIVWICGQIGWVISPEVANALVVVCGFLVALLAKDGTVSHTQPQ